MNLFDRFRRPGGLSCAQVQELVQSYLDDELDRTKADKLREHLHRCERCGVETDVYRRIKASLAAPAPPESVDRLRRFALAIPDTADDT